MAIKKINKTKLPPLSFLALPDKTSPFILIWLSFLLAAGFATTAWTASEDSGDSTQAVAIRHEPAFEYNLKRFTDVVKKAKRIEVLVYGPYRRAEGLKNCKICPEFVLDAAKHAEEAQMQTLCRNVLDSIKKRHRAAAQAGSQPRSGIG